MTFAGCTTDTPNVLSMDEAGPVAIQFGAGSNRVHTRADLNGGEAAAILNNSFHVYGVKTVSGTTKTVYPDYVVEYEGSTSAGTTNSNSRGWEYVGLPSHPSQTLHYWDFSAPNYTFQAWAPTTGTANVTVESPTTLSVSAPTASDLTKLYIADLVSINRDDFSTLNTYGGVVTFTFRNMTTKVRFGIYETIQGYSVSEVTFRSAAGRFTTSNTNALVDGTFYTADATNGITYHVTYNATTARAELTGDAAATLADYYDFGTFSQGVIGTESPNPTWAGGSSAYQNVMPNEDHASDMTLYIDFTLIPNDGSNDVLYVKGASVTVPQSYMIWHPNYAYTYLFKITKDVNGTTGDEGIDPVRLYPITFDAIIDETPGSETYETELSN